MNQTVHASEIGAFRAGLPAFLKAWKNKKHIMNTSFVGEKSTDYFTQHPYGYDDAFELHKPADRDFVILNFTDPHFADYDMRTLLAIPATRTMKRLVKEIRPDLITVTGDIICSDSGFYSIQRFCALMESFGIPWAPIFGNHDNETNCDLNFVSDLFLRCPHCLFRKGDPEMGWGNYIIHIVETDRNEKKQIVQSLIMMYHRDGYPSEKQLQWYSWAAEGVKSVSDEKAQAAVFLHIPLPEYQYAYDIAYDQKNNRWKPGHGACGEIHETICCERRDGVPFQRGFFNAIKAAGNTPHVLCGHEHINDFSVLYEGVRLTYLLKVGKGSGGGYGLNGGSVIRVGHEGIRRITHRAVNGPFKYNKEDILIQ